MHRSLSVVDVKRLLFLGAVEATFEPSLATKMLEPDEVDAATEAVSSRRAPTMDVEWLPDLRCNCLRLLGRVYALWYAL